MPTSRPRLPSLFSSPRQSSAGPMTAAAAVLLLANLGGPLLVSAQTTAAAKKEVPAKKAAAASGSADAADTGSPPPADSSPMAELKKTDTQLKKLIAKQPPSWSPEKDAKTSEVRKLVNNFLDFEELARRSLAKHWDTITPAQRREFTDTLHELVERSYLKQVHGQANYDVHFDREEKNGREATVFATLDTMSRGKKVQVALEYKMLWKRGKWLVYDVVTDEQSLLETYRAEFNKIINKESFDALLKRMKKKLEEKKPDDSAK